MRPELLAVSAQPRPARPVPRVVWALRLPVQRALLAVSAQLAASAPRFQVRTVPPEASARQRWVLREALGLRAVSVLPPPAELGQRHPARMEQLAAEELPGLPAPREPLEQKRLAPGALREPRALRAAWGLPERRWAMLPSEYCC